jgi:hypothetical protein
VTGVQTCALPISHRVVVPPAAAAPIAVLPVGRSQFRGHPVEEYRLAQMMNLALKFVMQIKMFWHGPVHKQESHFSHIPLGKKTPTSILKPQ